MKTKLIVLLIALVSPVLASGDHGADGHSHGAAKKLVGPNQGRVITQLEPDAELFVTAERKVRLTFIDGAGKPVAVPAGLGATLITGDRSAPVILTFAADGEGATGSLLTTAVLPEGKSLLVVLRVKPSAEARIVTVRVPLNLAICGECSKPEYACACAH
jgi:hypothetical protein